MWLKTIMPDLSARHQNTLTNKPAFELKEFVESRDVIIDKLNDNIQANLLLEPSDDTINFSLDATPLIPIFNNGVIVDFKLKH